MATINLYKNWNVLGKPSPFYSMSRAADSDALIDECTVALPDWVETYESEWGETLFIVGGKRFAWSELYAGNSKDGNPQIWRVMNGKQYAYNLEVVE